MKTDKPSKATRANKNMLGSVISYLLVTAVALRGIVQNPEVRLPIVGLLILFVLLMITESFISRPVWARAWFVMAQIGIMVGLFLLAPSGDYWAIMLFPACIYVMRHFRQAVAWTWIGIFVAAMSIMIIYGQGGVLEGLQFITIYVAAYLLVGGYALMLQQAEAAQEESQRLLRLLQQSNAQLQDYVVQIEELTVMKERNRLARDLHDAVTQSIFSMTLITRSALILQERDPRQVKEKLLQLQELAQSALQEMRSLIYQLRTLSVAEDGLYPVLQKFVDGLNDRGGPHITLNAEPEALPLSPIQQQELYRIIQEALNNVVKHAGANRATIQFATTKTAVMVTISDDGLGFDTALPHNDRTHIGLDSMRERAQELGGVLVVNSQPRTGTEIKVSVPISDERNPDGQD